MNNLFEKSMDAAKEGMDAIKKGANDLKKEMPHKDIKNTIEDAKEVVFDKASDVRQKAQDTGNELLKAINNFFKNTQDKVEDTKEEVVDFTSNKSEEIIDKAEELRINKKSSVGKKVAGAALVTAAATTAYIIYKKKKAEDESIKAEFSEKLKKWNELEKSEIEEIKKESIIPMRIKPSKVYMINNNGELGEDVIINISRENDNLTFNPNDEIIAINPIEQFRKKADEIAKSAGKSVKGVKELVAEKAGEFKETAVNTANDIKNKAQEKIEEVKEKSQEKVNLAQEKTDEIKDDLEFKVENVRADIKDEIEKTKEKVDKKEECIFENKMEKDPVEKIKDIEDDLIENTNTTERKWEDEKSVVTKKGEEVIEKASELKEKAQEALGKTSESIGKLKETITEKVSNIKKNANEVFKKNEYELDDDGEIEIFNVTIHNKGNKDYYFTPLLVQKYSSKRKMSYPCPCHEDDTTLEQKVIKPGETYTGKIALNITKNDDSIIVFEDLLMKNSVAYLLKDELDEEFIIEENEELENVNEIFKEE